MKKGKKKWLMLGAAVLAAILGVVQPELVPVIPVLVDAVVNPQPVEHPLKP